jgi:hypothetical protein
VPVAFTGFGMGDIADVGVMLFVLGGYRAGADDPNLVAVMDMPSRRSAYEVASDGWVFRVETRPST